MGMLTRQLRLLVTMMAAATALPQLLQALLLLLLLLKLGRLCVGEWHDWHTEWVLA